MASSLRLHGVLVAFKALLRGSHCVLPRSYGVLCGVPWHLHDVFTALSRRYWCTLRLHDVRTALPRRSGTALTASMQNRNEVSHIYTFAFKKIL